MIHFKQLEYRNFLSCGNNPITIQLDKSKSTLIVGANGSGKSTILDALSFALFGKAHRNVSKPLLVNAVNGKGCEVSITFETAGHEFKIIRGIKPNIFEVWQGGNMIDQSASVRDYQKFLEQNILKLNHKSFHQIVVLGSSSFIPFMQLTSNNRREVVEDLLDINIFSKMKGILKERNNLTKQNAHDSKIQLDNQKSKIVYQKKHIRQLDDLNKEASASNQETIDTLKEEIRTLGTEFDGYSTSLVELLTELNKSREELNGEAGICKHRIGELTQRGMFFENNDVCPTCTQEIGKVLKDEMLETVKQQARITAASVKVSNKSLSKNAEEIRGVSENIAEFTKLQATIKTKTTELNKLEKSKPVHADVKEPIADLYKLMNGADECRDTLDDCTDKLLYNDIAGEMLKDTGIRTKVIREYLPAMNTLINQYLQTLDFFVAFTLDENFDETIKSRHRDKFVYDNFSEGEKMRIDLSLLFTWRQIAKMKNSTNTNLLILDETFDSSLDMDGVDNLMKILLTLEEGTNTFIISHKPDILESKLRSKIEFEKVNNFSRMV